MPTGLVVAPWAAGSLVLVVPRPDRLASGAHSQTYLPQAVRDNWVNLTHLTRWRCRFLRGDLLMPLTPAQLSTLKTHIAANTNTVSYGGSNVAINSVPNNSDGNLAIANWYNLVASPDYWVWRTSVEKKEIVQQPSQDGTTFIWAGNGFISRSVQELECWNQLFNSTLTCNPSLANVRQAFSDIFSGTGNAASNRTHLLACGRRKATFTETLFAVNTPGSGAGRGTTADPDTMTFEGSVTPSEIDAARNLP
jgi:hypothetical protein